MNDSYYSCLTQEIEKTLDDNRIIPITEVITPRVAHVVIAKLLAFEGRNQSRPIDIYLMTPGGDCDAGMSIIDAIQLCKCKVNIYAIGSVASMGLPILVSATGTKKCYPHARFMYHEPSTEASGKFTDVTIRAHELGVYKEVVAKLLVEKTKLTEKDIEDYGSRDIFFSAQEALEKGFVDSIMDRR